MDAATWLSVDYGASALIEFDTGAIIQYGDEKDDQRRREFRERTAVASRLLHAVADNNYERLASDVGALDAFFQAQDLIAWLHIAIRDRSDSMAFFEYLLTPSEQEQFCGWRV